MKETARRVTQAERDRDGTIFFYHLSIPLKASNTSLGLVILEVSYYPHEGNGDAIRELAVDVTTPVQALVHNGQLYIPGGRPKVRLSLYGLPLKHYL